MNGSMEQGSTSLSTSDCNGYGNYTLQPKHKVFLSHSGAQKDFVEQLCVDLERCDRYPFFDKRRDSLPIGKNFPRLIFEAIEKCEVGVVILSEEFFTSKWPMLEFVAMSNVKKRKPSFTIVPILLGITLSQCRDVRNHEKWLSLWHTWGEIDGRIDVKDWANALQLLGPTNALKYNRELGEVKYREEIVKEICKLVPLGTRFEDSHVQGRSRLCKVVHEMIKESKIPLLSEVCIVGLYGVGGIGKTTVCKAMCNDLLEEYRDKVCHVELGSQSEEKLLKGVLEKLTDKNLEHLGAMDVDKYRHHLKKDMMNVKVFLTIDNVSSATSKQASTLLRANYGPGSVLLVTARSLNELTSLGIGASECIEMPELELEEAKSLFLYHATCVPLSYCNNKDDLVLILSCIQRCYFKKGDSISYHYNPLALQALGEQLQRVGFVPARWWLLLDEIDFLNPSQERKHPVFSILRRSFDALKPQDQLLFMDAALFAPYSGGNFAFKWNFFEWFGMIHGIRVNSVIERLENLKRQSLLENLGDGLGSIGMHDLWREFARLETKELDEFGKRRWIYEWDEYNALEEASVTRDGNVRRMFFLDKGFTKLEGVNFACFPDVTVLKLRTDFASAQELDLSGLKLLKSLELECGSYRGKSQRLISVVGLGSLSKLGFLRWLDIPSDSPCIDEIFCLTNLRVLDLYGCGRLPDLSSLILLEMASFRENYSVTTIGGLSSNHINLRFLDLSGCEALQSCSGVGELVALQELRLNSCSKLTEVPNLQKLKRLRKLHMHSCFLLRALPGLGDLVSLLELHAVCCESLAELPDMRSLKNLRILDLQYCERIKSLPGLNELVSLRSLKTCGCYNLTHLPDICKLTNLQTLELDPNHPLQSYFGSRDVISLRSLPVGIDELHDGPDLRMLTKLKRLHVSGWQGRGFLSLAELVLLESVIVHNCKGVRVLPDLKRLSRLRKLEFRSCEFEDLFGLINLTSLEELDIMDCDELEALPDLQELARLEELRVERCARLRDVRGILALRNLERLYARGHPWLNENLGSDLQGLTGLRYLYVSGGGFVDLQGLAACSQLHTLVCSRCPIQDLPDLANFPNFFCLIVRNCVKLTKLTCTGPLSPAFSRLDVHGCWRLQALPDLTNSRMMQLLDVANSGVVLSTQVIQDVNARWPSILLVTEETSSPVRLEVPDVPEVPEVSDFPELFQLSYLRSHVLGHENSRELPSILLVTEETSSPVRLEVPEVPELLQLSCGSSHVLGRESSRELSHGSSRGFWRRCLGMIASLHCGCTGTSSAVTRPS